MKAQDDCRDRLLDIVTGMRDDAVAAAVSGRVPVDELSLSPEQRAALAREQWDRRHPVLASILAGAGR